MEGIDEQTVNRFMEDTGHSKDINKNIYAVAPGLSILQTVVPVIKRLDTVPSVHLLRFDKDKHDDAPDLGTQERRTDCGDQCHEPKRQGSGTCSLMQAGDDEAKQADHCYRRTI